MNYQLENVNVIYDMKKDAQTFALKDISLSLEGNRLIGILGPSGSGKSSLLYSLAGLRQPTSGRVLYNGSDLTHMNPSALAALRRKEFGFIFQRHFLINYMTVMENILVPLNLNTINTRKKAIELMERLGISHLANKKPYQLSGGERQRAAIVRALMSEPKVIFGDEPTAALDHKSAQEVMRLLTEYTKSAMVIIVTHDESILKNADMIIRIWDGTIAEICTQKQEGTE